MSRKKTLNPKLDIYAMVRHCPRETPDEACPFNEMRSKPLERILAWVGHLPNDEANALREHHRQCIENAPSASEKAMKELQGYINENEALAQAAKKRPKPEGSKKIQWQGRILSIQCRAWIWRYMVSNRTHHHLGFNLWIQGEVDGKEGKFILAVSDSQHQKQQFQIGDVFKGSAWPCIRAKHDIADYYRAGGFKRIEAATEATGSLEPPYTGLLPPLETFERRGARMLDSKLWNKKCFTCKWANKSAVEIEWDFGKVKRYRKETFCYGPLSCPQYQMGKPRPVQYKGTFDSMDEGWLDEMCVGEREEED